jgi:hypothetical protein
VHLFDTGSLLRDWSHRSARYQHISGCVCSFRVGVIFFFVFFFFYLNFLNSRASLRGNEPIPLFHSVRWGTRRALGPTAVSQFWPLELFHPITCFIDEYLISNFSSTICVMFGLLIDNMLQDYIRCWHLQGGPLISLLSIFNTEKPTFCT